MKRFFKGITSIYDTLIVLAFMLIIMAICLFLIGSYYGDLFTKEISVPKNHESSAIFEDKGIAINVAAGFSEKEVEEILDELHQEFGQDMLYKILEPVLDEKDDQNRHYSELTIVAAEKDGNEDDVYWFKFRKYLSENDDFQVGKVVCYLSAKSNKVKKSDLEK